jgi:hypothetical protein
MAYKYLKASPSLNLTTKEIFVNDFQALLDEQFSLASDVWTVQEESTFASEVYEDVEVRIVTHVINSATGKYLPDDYKQILFKDLAHAVGLGYMYQFDDNYWIVTNSEKTKNLAAGAIVKRCNNTLRWIDINGAIHTEPCSVDYNILRNMDYTGMSATVVVPSGTIEIIAQFNDRTTLIRPNQRFLFGNVNNWTAYRIVGGGINNYQNIETLSNTAVGFIKLTLSADYISDNDDLTLGIAYEDKNVYTLTLSESTIAGIPTNTRQLYASVTLNGTTVTRTVEWSSSDTAKATVSATGLVTLVANGTATITCHLVGDTSVSDTVAVTVSGTASDYYQVTFSPDKNYILEGDTQAYTVYLYKNGTIQGNTFVLSCGAGTVPTDHFAFSYSASPGNTFSIENVEKFLSDHLTITCTSVAIGAVPPTPQVGVLEINLRGVW